MTEIINLYDRVYVKTKGVYGNVILIDDDNGTKPPLYFIESDKVDSGGWDNWDEVLFWCEWRDVEKVPKKSIPKLKRKK